MHKCGTNPYGQPIHKPAPRGHVNAFVDLNGVPYLLAEYLDRRNFLQLDRSMIRSEIFVDTRESMRAIIDISIDDIGKRPSDGYPAVIGNTSKQKALLNNTASMRDQLNHQFDVLRRGIIMRVNYQLENQRTGSVIRSMVEDLRISDRSYFLDVNPHDINDNAVIVNFSNSLVSTINEFTHGRDPMVLRITSVQMFYECLRRDPGVARIRQAPTELDYYNYHTQMQNHHIFAPNGSHYESYGCEPEEMIMPPTWSMFSRYYHFDQNGHDIVLHKSEVENPQCQAVVVPCGTVQVNRAFMINPGHRIIFKFSVWKNDVTVVSDCLPVAEAIRTPYLNYCNQIPYENYIPDYGFPADKDYTHPNHHYPYQDKVDPPHKPSVHHEDPILRELRKAQRVNEQQSKSIAQLAAAVNAMRDIILSQHEGSELPGEIKVPEVKPGGHHHGPPPGDPIADKLNSLEELLQAIKDQTSEAGDECDHTEIDERIAQLEAEIADMRTHGTDTAVADQLVKLEQSINELKEMSDCSTHNHPQKISEEKVNELLDKIQDA